MLVVHDEKGFTEKIPLKNINTQFLWQMPLTKITRWAFLALTVAWLFAFCKKNDQASDSNPPFLNLDEGVGYVGMAVCASCHKEVHATYIHTGMGRSFDRATRQKTAAQFGAHALVYDTARNFYYFPFFEDSTFFVLEFRLENGDTVHRRLEKISYIVGSGQHTNSHLLDINGYAYQAPVTYYTQEGRWDLAPGFRGNNSRFDRFLTDECITCHNHYPVMQPGSLNKFSDMPKGIECERCHGPGQLHAERMLRGMVVDTAKETDFTIVNPRKLPRDLQMDLCQRCHLQGVAVLNEGKTFFDFKPGMRLSDVMNVFLPRYSDSHERFIMASQSDRLRLSECFQHSEEITCLTCHHPHRSVEVTPVSQYNNACKKCHSQNPQTVCTASASERQALEDNCAGCHMPKSGSTDIPHVRITDHRVAVPGPKTAAGNSQAATFSGIQIMTKENPTPLEMAKGYLATHDKYIQSPIMLDSAGYYLDLSKARFEEKFPALIHLFFLRENYEGIVENALKYRPATMPDGWTAYRIGEAFFKKGEYDTALRYYEQATGFFPFHLDFLEKKGATLANLKRLSEAEKTLEKVLSENPRRPVALNNLGFVKVLQGKMAEGQKLYDQAIALDPDYEQVLVNKAALLIFLKKPEEARRLLLRVLKINPGNEQAVEGMRQLMTNG